MSYFFDEQRLDDAVSILLEHLRTHEDQKNRPIDFECGYLKDEHYKYDVYKNGRKALDCENWTPDMIGSGKIFNGVLQALKKGDNLVNFYTNGFEVAAEDNIKQAEQAFYDLYVNNLDEKAFQEITELFGAHYSRTAYFFFLKDKTKYLPCKPALFKEKFQLMGIKSNCTSGLTWENYLEFIEIITKLQGLLLQQYKVDGTLLDIHSFVWVIYLVEGSLKQLQYDFDDEANGEIQISQEQWEEMLQDENLVTETAKQTLARFFFAPDHTATCKELGEQAGVDPSSFISPIVSVGKRVSRHLHLPQFENRVGGEKLWVVPFLGRRLRNNLYEWRMRPELANAFANVCQKEIEEMAEQLEAEEAVSLPLEALYEQVKDYGTNEPVDQKVVSIKQYKRNSKVAEWAKRRENGICLRCGETLDFKDKEGRPYLEAHHVIPLSEGGKDSIYNVVALCPNCHKRMHIVGDPDDIDFLQDCLNTYKERGQ